MRGFKQAAFPPDDPVWLAAVAERRALCAACSRKAYATCTECGCLIVAKTASETEACPLGKWGAIEAPPIPPPVSTPNGMRS